MAGVNFSRLMDRLLDSRLRFRMTLLFGLGAFATLAMPPWTFWPALWLALPLFLIVTGHARSRRETAVLGWSFGFGYFAAGFAWMRHAFFVDADTFGALAFPAIGGLAAGFGLYFSVTAVALTVLPALPDDALARDRFFHRLRQVLVFAAAVSLVEWWRGWFLTGLPWNPIGNTWVGTPEMLQIASLTGVYGLGLITVVAASSLYLLLDWGSQSRRIVLAIAVCHLPLAGTAVWGNARLPEEPLASVTGITLRLVQPNIAQSDKWRPGLREQHVRNQVAMSTQDAGTITHVLWAETAAPFPLNRAPTARATVAQASPAGGFLLTGAPRIEGDGQDRKAFNSFYAVSPDGTIAATFDKSHLVPFGEYIPFATLLPLTQLTGGSGFTPGSGLRTLELPGLPAFSPLICYEIIFPGRVARDDKRPEWLFNLTNDAWFGLSSGPYQHLAAAQLRAVEEGLPVVRVANTGISAVIDPYGRISASIPLGQAGVLDRRLPRALPATVFAQFHHLPLFVVAFLMIGGAVISGRQPGTGI